MDPYEMRKILHPLTIPELEGVQKYIDLLILFREKGLDGDPTEKIGSIIDKKNP